MADRPLVGIVAAAGSGDRLGAGAKAFVACAGRPLVDWSIDALGAVCDRVVAAVPPGAEDRVPDGVAGGPSRSESVLMAVRAAPEAAVYAVQDAARPLVTRDLVERCVAALGEGFDGAVAAARVTDTVKEAGPDGAVERTLDRSSLWAVQTPQVFRAEALRNALAVGAKALAAATDDASLVEAAGGSVTVVEASPENIKVTRPIDLSTAEALLRSRAGRGVA